mmetsp:Transcript_15790/g.14288  ORF Transcript_15790/g.14288 Transcript_15790/m.14288 type:complete len:253 (+) Transcript_15790:56-814(+)
MYSLLLVIVTLLGTTNAFLTSNSRVNNGVRSLNMLEEKSIAFPFDKRPPALDGTLPGDAGFDPAGFTNNPPKAWLIGGEAKSLKWYREAEIVHGRVAQLAVLGNIIPAYFHFPGNPGFGVAADAFAATNPYTALVTVPPAALWQIALVIYGIELARIQRVIRGDKEPGDLGLGQTGFNPFGFNYTPEQYFEKQVQEIKHGRLAMVAIIAELLQAKISGVGVIEQISGAFNFPDAVEVVKGGSDLADYFPAGL